MAAHRLRRELAEHLRELGLSPVPASAGSEGEGSAEVGAAELAVALAEELTLTLGLPRTFHEDGHWITIYSITLRDWSSWNEDTIHFTASLRYKRTRGLVQFSTKGTARMHFTITWPNGLLIPPVCIEDLNVDGLDLRRIPNWLDDSWIRDKINQELPSMMCHYW